MKLFLQFSMHLKAEISSLSNALKSLINLVSSRMLGKMHKQHYCERAFLNVNLIAHKKILCALFMYRLKKETRGLSRYFQILLKLII